MKLYWLVSVVVTSVTPVDVILPTCQSHRVVTSESGSGNDRNMLGCNVILTCSMLPLLTVLLYQVGYFNWWGEQGGSRFHHSFLYPVICLDLALQLFLKLDKFFSSCNIIYPSYQQDKFLKGWARWPEFILFLCVSVVVGSKVGVMLGGS